MGCLMSQVYVVGVDEDGDLLIGQDPRAALRTVVRALRRAAQRRTRSVRSEARGSRPISEPHPRYLDNFCGSAFHIDAIQSAASMYAFSGR